MRPFLALILTLAVLPGQGRAEGRIPSDCFALAQTAPDVVPVDGAYTMQVVLTMHWFTPEGLANFLVEFNPDPEIVVSDSAEVILRPALAP